MIDLETNELACTQVAPRRHKLAILSFSKQSHLFSSAILVALEEIDLVLSQTDS